MFRPLRLTFLCLIVAFTTPVSPDIIWRKLLGEMNRTEGDQTTPEARERDQDTSGPNGADMDTQTRIEMGDLAGILDDEMDDDDVMKRKDLGPGAAFVQDAAERPDIFAQHLAEIVPTLQTIALVVSYEGVQSSVIFDVISKDEKVYVKESQSQNVKFVVKHEGMIGPSWCDGK